MLAYPYHRSVAAGNPQTLDSGDQRIAAMAGLALGAAPFARGIPNKNDLNDTTTSLLTANGLILALPVLLTTPLSADSIPAIVAKAKPAVVEIVASDPKGVPKTLGTGESTTAVEGQKVMVIGNPTGLMI